MIYEISTNMIWLSGHLIVSCKCNTLIYQYVHYLDYTNDVKTGN